MTMFYPGEYFLRPQPCTLNVLVPVPCVGPNRVIFPTRQHLITFADLMSIEQTSNWIWTFGFENCWEEAEYYATQFKLYRIDGKCLPKLTNERLERMSISNHFHRMAILSTIAQLFPFNSFGDMSPVPSCPIPEINEGSFDGDDEHFDKRSEILNSSTPSVNPIDMEISPSPSPSESMTPIDRQVRWIGSPISTRKCSSKDEHDLPYEGKVIASCLRIKKLCLEPTREEEQLSEEEQIKHYYSKFKKHGYDVEISPPDATCGSFTIEFADVMMAQKALIQAKEIGNILSAKKLKRPTPSCPCKFKVLSTWGLTVRDGRTLKAKIVGQKKSGEVVLVNRTKGRRARLCTEENGKYKNIGWVSLFTSRGYPLMFQLDGVSVD